MMTTEDHGISARELNQLSADSYTLIDVRHPASFSYGSIQGAVNLPDVLDSAERGELPLDRMPILFCMHGDTSKDLAGSLCRRGVDARYLIDGYEGWLRENCDGADRSLEAQRSITGKRRFKEKLFQPFTKAIVEFDMIRPGDRIAVCISGGKDSMLMAKLFQELKRHDKFPFELVFLVMDPGYNALNRMMIENNAKALGIPVTIFETRIFDAVYKIDKSPCYLCARMRRGHLYKQARDLGCNKIALGHHYDDVIETILMGMLWGGQIQTMMPKLRSTNFEGMELIRPLYYVREADIKAWRDHLGLHFIQCACRFTDESSRGMSDGANLSKRLDTKLLIRELKKTNPHVEANIFNSMHNVNVDTVIAYKKNGVKHSFLEAYEQNGGGDA